MRWLVFRTWLLPSSVGDDDAVETFGASLPVAIIKGEIPQAGFGKLSQRVDIAGKAFEPVHGTGWCTAQRSFGLVFVQVPAADDLVARHGLAEQLRAHARGLPLAVAIHAGQIIPLRKDAGAGEDEAKAPAVLDGLPIGFGPCQFVDCIDAGTTAIATQAQQAIFWQRVARAMHGDAKAGVRVHGNGIGSVELALGGAALLCIERNAQAG